jgi:hypothetical protein
VRKVKIPVAQPARMKLRLPALRKRVLKKSLLKNGVS